MSNVTSSTMTSSSTVNADPIRVMVVDDAIVIRSLMTRWLDACPEIAVVATHRNGKAAVDDMERADPEVIILDIEMPEMDGLTALPLLLKKKPGVSILMASTLTRRNAEISFKALSLGASDYVPKPETHSSVSTSVDFQRDLIEKVLSLGKGRRLKKIRKSSPSPVTLPSSTLSLSVQGGIKPVRDFSFIPYRPMIPKALFIGSSTGGPQALQTVLTSLSPSLDKVPTFITQHMPQTFTQILAENLTRNIGRMVKEGEHDEEVQAGVIYVAPGNYHMQLVRKNTKVLIKLDQEPPINFCRPSVDPMFISGAKVYNQYIAGVILTGMGADGHGGVEAVAQAGGNVLAQDEESSVVFGMPQAAAAAGCCVGLFGKNDMARAIRSLLTGVKP